MEELLERTLGPPGVTWEAIDVDTEPRLQELFSDLVPVLLRDGRPVAKLRLTADRLLRIVNRRR